MARRVFAGRPVVRAQRRKTLWLEWDIQTDFTVLAFNTKLLNTGLNAAALAFRPFTIVRVISDLFVGSDQVAAIEFPFGAVGVTVVTDEAVAAGAASIPGPYTNSSSDWLFHEYFAADVRFISGAGTEFNTLRHQHSDQKAMRKVDVGSDMITVVENTSSADGLAFIWSLRILIKLN